MKKMKLLSLLLAVMMCFGVFSACGNSGDNTSASDIPSETEAPEDDWTYIQEKGKLVIGITIYEPMNYFDANGELTGFDTEFALAVCEKLGIEAEFVEINWDTKEVELAAKNIDCIWNGLTVTEERKANMDFTESYIKNMQVAVVRTSDADKYVDVASLSAAKLVAEISSAGEAAIQADAALAGADYTAMAKQTDALLEVKAGTADVAILDYTLAKSMVGEGSDYSDLMIVDGLELAVEEYAIGFRPGSTAVAKINAVIEELAAAGTLNTISVAYELENQLIFNQ